MIVNGKERMLCLFIHGDYEYLTKNFGHQGACATWPCILCFTQLADLIAGMAHAEGLEGKLRLPHNTPMLHDKAAHVSNLVRVYFRYPSQFWSFIGNRLKNHKSVYLDLKELSWTNRQLCDVT